MPHSKILVMYGSLRPQSHNAQLALLAARQMEDEGASVTLADLGEYALPIYDARIQEKGIPLQAEALHELFAGHDGVFLTTPEYNAFPSPLLLNALDWVSRVEHSEGGMLAAFGRAPFAIGSASPGAFGGYRAAIALRHKLELGLGASVLPAMACVPHAYQAFDSDGNFASRQSADLLAKVTHELVAAAARRAAPASVASRPAKIARV